MITTRQITGHPTSIVDIPRVEIPCIPVQQTDMVAAVPRRIDDLKFSTTKINDISITEPSSHFVWWGVEVVSVKLLWEGLYHCPGFQHLTHLVPPQAISCALPAHHIIKHSDILKVLAAANVVVVGVCKQQEVWLVC